MSEVRMIGTILVQRCMNGKILYMLAAGKFSKWFQTMNELKAYAAYNKIQLDPNVREM
jgi:hypothetical protein